MTPNIADIIRHHVALEVRCIDRLYLNGYMPKLQTSGGLCYFLRDHRGHPIPSPALFKPMHDRFVTACTSSRPSTRFRSCPSNRAKTKTRSWRNIGHASRAVKAS